MSLGYVAWTISVLTPTPMKYSRQGTEVILLPVETVKQVDYIGVCTRISGDYGVEIIYTNVM